MQPLPESMPPKRAGLLCGATTARTDGATPWHEARALRNSSPASGGMGEVYRTRCTLPRNFFALLRSDNPSAYRDAAAWLGRGGGHSMHVCMARDRT